MKKAIGFTKLRYLFIFVSIIPIVTCFVLIFTGAGFNLSIDFTGGLNYEVQFNDNSIDIEEVREAVSVFPKSDVKAVGDGSQAHFSIRVDVAEAEENASTDSLLIQTQSREEELTDVLHSAFGEDSFSLAEDVSTDYVGPSLARDLASQSFVLLAFAMLFILIYIWVRFRFAYAISAIVTLVHDVLYMMALIGVLQLEFSIATMAAILTIVGYSLNDTIIVFDRIRENEGLVKDKTLPEIINISITQTLGRTVITSLTTVAAIVPLYIFGIGYIQMFALNFIIGIGIGTYSSIFIASILYLFTRSFMKKNDGKKDDKVTNKKKLKLAKN